MNVTDIQQHLLSAGYSPGKVDGAFGPETARAVRQALGIPLTEPLPIKGGIPKWLTLAISEIGVREDTSAASNPKVLGYYSDASHPDVKSDAVPWCAAFVGAMLKRAGVKPSGSLLARSYLDWGVALDEPRLGCIVVLSRGKPPFGHVGFYSGPGTIISGNSAGDAVTDAKFTKGNVLGYRWPTA